MRTSTLCIGLLLFVTPPLASATASPQIMGELAADQVTMEGHATLAGGLRVIALRGNDTANDAAPADEGVAADHILRVTGERLVVEVQHSEREISAVAIDGPPNKWSSRYEHHNAQLLGLQVRGGHAFFLASLPNGPEAQATVEFSSGMIAPPSDESVMETQVFVQSRDAQRRPTTGAVAWDGTSDATAIIVTGSFQFSMWSWDSIITEDGQTTEYRSGEERNEAVSANGLRGVGSTHMRHVYVTVHDGRLELEPRPTKYEAFYFTANEISVDGVTRFHNVEGTVGDQPLGQGVGDVLRAEGGLVISNLQVDERIRASVRSSNAHLHINDEAVRQARQDPISPAWVALAVVGASAIIGGTALTMVPAGMTFADLAKAMEQRRYQRVVRNADRFLADATHGADAARLKVIALLALRRYDDAGRFLHRLDPPHEPDPLTLAFVRKAVRDRRLPVHMPPDDAVRFHLADTDA